MDDTKYHVFWIQRVPLSSSTATVCAVIAGKQKVIATITGPGYYLYQLITLILLPTQAYTWIHEDWKE